MRAALVIESPSISTIPEWNEALDAAKLLIRDRRDWEALTHEDLSRCSDGVIVANAASAPGKAAAVFEWLREHPVRTRTFGILPANDLEMIRLGAYRKGSNAEVDEAINFYAPLEEFLRQRKDESTDFAGTYAALAKILGVAWS